MRTIILFIFYMTSFSAISQKSQFAFFAPFDSPVKSVMPNMRTNAGIGFSYAYRPYDIPIMGEIKVSFGSYAGRNYYESYNLYEYYDPTRVTFNYKNKMNKYLIGAKYHIGYDFRAVRGFVSPQIGFVTFKTKNSYSYTDPNNNSKSDNNLAKFSVCGIYGGEVGVEIDLNSIFTTAIKSDVHHHVFISASIYKGFKEVKYTNVRNIQTIENIDPSSGISLEDHSTYVAFSNNYFYDDKVTAVYTSKFLTWGINVGYIINFGRE